METKQTGERWSIVPKQDGVEVKESAREERNRGTCWKRNTNTPKRFIGCTSSVYKLVVVVVSFEGV